MKTTTRTPRNGSAARTSIQAPNQPEHTNKTSPRFEGIVLDIIKNKEIAGGGIGRIYGPDVPGSTMQAVFRLADLPEGRDRDLRIGGRVSFRLAKNEQGSVALDLRAITLAPELPADGWEPLTAEFIATAIELHETKRGERLCRDKAGRLFVARKIRNASKRAVGTEYREVSFAQACDWLVNQRHEMIPEMFLARHGILEQARLVRKLAPPNLEDAINKSVALAVLMQERMCYSETLALGGDMQGSFGAGLTCLVSESNRALLESFYGTKGGVK